MLYQALRRRLPGHRVTQPREPRPGAEAPGGVGPTVPGTPRAYHPVHAVSRAAPGAADDVRTALPASPGGPPPRDGAPPMALVSPAALHHLLALDWQAPPAGPAHPATAVEPAPQGAFPLDALTSLRDLGAALRLQVEAGVLTPGVVRQLGMDVGSRDELAAAYAHALTRLTRNPELK